jgi:hypothetical protein
MKQIILVKHKPGTPCGIDGKEKEYTFKLADGTSKEAMEVIQEFAAGDKDLARLRLQLTQLGYELKE